MSYKYVNCEPNESQYEDYDLSVENIVDAIYVPARVDVDKGNPYIEALPYPRSDDDIKIAYTRMLPSYRHDKVKDMSDIDKMLQVGMLRELRFPLPFHKNLEFQFYNALITSYRARKAFISHRCNIQYTMSDKTQKADRTLCGDSGAATNAGFSLIGFSGCGKSSAIKILTSYYPQVIMHKDDKGGRFPQITYLVVNCVTNSNFAALYEGIGDAIDKAFGNSTPIYAREIAKTAGLGKKAEKVKNLIELFGIGAIIFDEIQLIDFQHTKENTFDSLLTLANRTKVGIIVVGTEDARDKMFRELRTARRVGVMINGNTYCDSRKFFNLLVKQLFQYQWFDEMVSVTDDIADALYNVSKGIVDQLVGVYSCMNYDYISRRKKPEINGDYVYEIAKKYYPGIQEVLANLELEESDRKMAEARIAANNQVAKLMDNAQQKEMQKMLSNAQKDATTSAQLSNIYENITKIYDEYSDIQIEAAFRKVMSSKAATGKSEKEITRMVIDILQKPKKTKKSDSQIIKPDLQHIQSFINKDEN